MVNLTGIERTAALRVYRRGAQSAAGKKIGLGLPR